MGKERVLEGRMKKFFSLFVVALILFTACVSNPGRQFTLSTLNYEDNVLVSVEDSKELQEIIDRSQNQLATDDAISASRCMNLYWSYSLYDNSEEILYTFEGPHQFLRIAGREDVYVMDDADWSRATLIFSSYIDRSSW